MGRVIESGGEFIFDRYIFVYWVCMRLIHTLIRSYMHLEHGSLGINWIWLGIGEQLDWVG